MQRLLPLLPKRPQRRFVRFGVATISVAASFSVFILLRRSGGPNGLYLLYPAVFFCSFAYDRATGFYVTALEAIGLYLLLRVPGAFFLPSGYPLALLLFVVIAIGLAWGSDAVRNALERTVEAEYAKDLLLRELGHRTKNNLAMVVSVLSFQSRANQNPEVRSALQNALSRVHAISSAHNHVQQGETDGVTDMRDYLETLCAQLGDALRGVRPIAISAKVANVELPTAQAISVGLIVNELVTNALKHAFPGDRAGTIRVALESKSPLRLIVEDDGVGCAAPTGASGTGMRLVKLLVQQLQGEISWQSREPGCRVTIELT
jgi:two-component sensor histidine kinase